jgi:hypothetical protein
MKYSCLPDHCGQGVITRVSTYLAVQIRRTTSVIIAPCITAQPRAQFDATPPTRDNHLLMMQSLGRLEWQHACGYSKRAQVKTTMDRFKAIIGPKLRARDARGQRPEVNAVAVLNRMLGARTPFALQQLLPNTL